MFFKDKSVFVAGGNGFLGRSLVTKLKAQGAIVSFPSSNQCDFTNKEESDRYFATVNPEIVINAAGYLGGINFSRLFPADVFMKNTLINCNIISACATHKVSKLVNVGSACLYSDELSGPFREIELIKGPMHSSVKYYGFSKLVQIFGADAFREQYGLNSIHLVPANLYGPNDKFDPELSHVISSLIPKFYHARETRQDVVTCWGSGKTIRDFLFVEDCATAILMASESYDSQEPLNVGSGDGVMIKDLAEKIKRLTGYKGRIYWDNTKPDGAPYKVLDTSKIRSELNWQPQKKLIEGLEETLDYFSLNYNAWLKKFIT